jgi:hypothetical protein
MRRPPFLQLMFPEDAQDENRSLREQREGDAMMHVEACPDEHEHEQGDTHTVDNRQEFHAGSSG